eukprot:2445655-Pyramimonas_sp.AAC.1
MSTLKRWATLGPHAICAGPELLAPTASSHAGMASAVTSPRPRWHRQARSGLASLNMPWSR